MLTKDWVVRTDGSRDAWVRPGIYEEWPRSYTDAELEAIARSIGHDKLNVAGPGRGEAWPAAPHLLR